MFSWPLWIDGYMLPVDLRPISGPGFRKIFSITYRRLANWRAKYCMIYVRLIGEKKKKFSRRGTAIQTFRHQVSFMFGFVEEYSTNFSCYQTTPVLWTDFTTHARHNRQSGRLFHYRTPPPWLDLINSLCNKDFHDGLRVNAGNIKSTIDRRNWAQTERWRMEPEIPLGVETTRDRQMKKCTLPRNG